MKLMTSTGSTGARHYAPPTVRIYGDVAQLTANGTQNGSEAQDGQTKVPKATGQR